ncbi:MAG: hypothetical protein GY799_01735 [Desulfobulbaceae bacterium]|nr:hypothetical protein [Desulfobulbaceae bacterium]
MTRNSSQKNSNIYVMVAFGHQRQQLVPSHVQSEQLIWCPNVYDALANVVTTLNNGQNQTVCVLLDSLIISELHIFSALAQFDQIKTIAISSMPNLQKANQALLSGADQVLSLSNFIKLFKDGPETEIPSPSQENSHTTQPDLSLDNLLYEEIKSTDTQPEEITTNEIDCPDQTKVTLTKEEMDALLKQG